MNFDDDFIFGAATSAYQIEGAPYEDDKSASIWDLFCKGEGNTKMQNGDLACDSYHRYAEDVKILKDLGAGSYRFSISWPRIFPQEGRYNPKGMQYYKNLIKELTDNGIEPFVTLYHWDLPQWAEEKGGWLNRDCATWFAQYSKKCFEELGTQVTKWITLNEPFCSSILGYAIGLHAPGHKNLQEALCATHHLLLAHGLAVVEYQKLSLNSEIGISLNLCPVCPKSEDINDIAATNIADGINNRYFLDPVFFGKYPLDMLSMFIGMGCEYDFAEPGDMNMINQPIDFLGINFYSANIIEYNSSSLFKYGAAQTSYKKTDMDWDIRPESLQDILAEVRRYTDLPIYITENGSAWKDELDKNGKVEDDDRIDYLERHLKEIARLNSDGMNIKGYFAWSLLDNFEWAEGYSKRFGLVHMDYDTFKRTPKKSYYRYAEIIRNRKV